MITEFRTYQIEELNAAKLAAIQEPEIVDQLNRYLAGYSACFEKRHLRYFLGFEQGILSALERKSLEPIALHHIGEHQVRGLQHFFTRSTGWDDMLKEHYQNQLAEQIADVDGFMSVDESCFVKKGKASVGVSRQYCGRLGKVENCQAGVFVSYASKRGYGLLDSRLYLPQEWFGEDRASERTRCQVPVEASFHTKNEIAQELIAQVREQKRFPVRWLGCDAAFGSDHSFLDALPEELFYFAAVGEDELVFLGLPEVAVPQNSPGKRGGRFKHPRASFPPVEVKTIAIDESIPWTTTVLAEGAKGPIVSETKCVRCYSSRKVKQHQLPYKENWLYLRKYENGKIRYFLSNGPEDTDMGLLDKLATLRWSIEQCFQECKSYLGMAQYESRSYAAWHRHMLLVMVAHLFTIVLRNQLKRGLFF
jgi:SRSO17 transposase